MWIVSVNFPIDLIIGRPRVDHNTSVHEYIEDLRLNTEIVHDITREHLKQSGEYQKRNYETNVKESTLKVGSFIWLHNISIKPGLARKLVPKWKGPYLIVAKIGDVNYQIQLNKN